MIAEILLPVGTFLAGGGATALAAYVRSSWGQNPSPTSAKGQAQRRLQKFKDMSTYDAVKAGYAAVSKMAKDIHDLYHPPGCKCAMCQIRADDEDEDPNAYSGEFCSLPCFNCSVITCPMHPDRKPQRKMEDTSLGIPVPANMVRAEKHAKAESRRVVVEQDSRYDRPNACCLRSFPNAAPGDRFTCKECQNDWRAKEHGPLDIKWQRLSGRYIDDDTSVAAHDERRKDTAIQNLETQLKQLTEAYQQVVAQRDSLANDRGLISAGMHVGGQPLYMVDKLKASYGPQSGPGSRPPLVDGVLFERDPKETDRQAMQRLARACRQEGLRRQEAENPGGTMIEEFGEGPVRYVPPPKRKQQTVYVRPGEWRTA